MLRTFVRRVRGLGRRAVLTLCNLLTEQASNMNRLGDLPGGKLADGRNGEETRTKIESRKGMGR